MNRKPRDKQESTAISLVPVRHSVDPYVTAGKNKRAGKYTYVDGARSFEHMNMAHVEEGEGRWWTTPTHSRRVQMFKGTVSWNFLLQVFFHESSSPSP